ncbi:RusA family crossover junction endodeoxyribonuclease [Nocardiopsis sp. NPDC006139]|uniref:RusA family crossover junction endodeoxyribonuclease n=1 Tax=Nocardiopsis sp. NPDC006139 TaxID=3154578 RepID=UPI0033BB760B
MDTHSITRWDLAVTVHGTPAGQGQVSFLGKGRPAIHSNQKKLLPWREAIITAVRAELARTAGPARPAFVGEPMETDITITVAKPKSAPKRRRTWPITRSSTDLDHHVRAVHDALSRAGAFGDDSQVVETKARKVYPGEHPLALGEPGALIRVRVLPESLLGAEVAR